MSVKESGQEVPSQKEHVHAMRFRLSALEAEWTSEAKMQQYNRTSGKSIVRKQWYTLIVSAPACLTEE